MPRRKNAGHVWIKCPACKGKGNTRGKPCAECSGRGTDREPPSNKAFTGTPIVWTTPENPLRYRATTN